MEKITSMTYPNIIAENADINPKYLQNAKTLAFDMVKEFLDLCKVPHPSKHVEKMREYLYKWGKREGLETHIDPSGCVYIDIPAAEGCEDIPKVILQSHYDMVAVAASTNKDYIPTETPIKPYFDKENNCIHTHWKTSLGADDGQGLAASMAIAKLHRNPENGVKHGPIRLLFTYDEETDMQGVTNLTDSVIDSKYLINLDNIYVGIVLSSSAGAFYGSLSKTYQLVYAPEETSVFKWKLGGFVGGHSGEDIHKGRGSTVEMLKEFLQELVNTDIPFEICEINAGTLMNAIAAKMNLELIVNTADLEKVKTIAGLVYNEAKKRYIDAESLWQEISSDIAFANPVMNRSDSLTLLNILHTLPNGIVSYLDAYDEKGRQRPETSSNIGNVTVKNGALSIKFLFRSAKEKIVKKAVKQCEILADRYKLDFTIEGVFPGWEKIENNLLNDLFLESYPAACGFEGTSLDIHSGLECGYLSSKYPNLIMASVGCDLINEHTVKETLFTKSMPAYFASLLYVLEHLK